MNTSHTRLTHTLLLFLLSIIIGISVSIIDTVFGKVLLRISDFRVEHFIYFIPFLALAGAIFTYIYQRYGSSATKGMTLVFETADEKTKETSIPLRMIPFSIVGTWLTHLFGGSAGREGVAVQLGATLANRLGNIFHLDNDRKSFIVIGIAAGFAGLFETPIAATFFATEVLIVGTLYYKAIPFALVAAFSASAMSSYLGLEKFNFALQNQVPFSLMLIVKLIAIGILFGLVGAIFAKLLQLSKTFFAKYFPNPIIRIIIGGICISIASILLYSGRYSGLGTNLINDSFLGHTIYDYDWLIKIGLTVITIGVGFLGGEVTPLFAIGASFGVVLSSIFQLPFTFVAALGYASVFGSATRTFLAPSFIGAEVFGFSYLPYFLLVCTIAYLVNQKYSIYSAQKYHAS